MFLHVAADCTWTFESDGELTPVVDDVFTVEISYDQGRFVATGTFTSSTTCSGTYFFEGAPGAGVCPTSGTGTFVAQKDALAHHHRKGAAMIIVLKPGATQAEIDHVIEKIEAAGCKPHLSRGVERTIIGAIGDESALRNLPLEILPGVDQVMAIQKPYKTGLARVQARAERDRRRRRAASAASACT